MKKVDYSETFAACDLKLIDLMKICIFAIPQLLPLKKWTRLDAQQSMAK